MGLDQYAYAGRFTPEKQVAFKNPEGVELKDLAYWRKHSSLQGWMQRLAVEKGFDYAPDNFNCTPVVLTGEDLDRLEKDVKARALPKTGGFFFGNGRDGDYYDEDLVFIAKARVLIAEGLTVFYNSWW